MVEVYANSEILLIAKAILIAVLGVFIGYILKYLLRKGIDTCILKKIFKEDASTYETSVTINRVFTEMIQWLIILAFLNHSLTILGFNFLSRAFEYIIADIPKIAIFVAIIAIGFLFSKLVVSRIRDREIENKTEIITLVEIIIIAAFLLTALEFIGVRATALIELYKVILYIIGILIVLFIIKPDIFKKPNKKKSKKQTESIKTFFNF